MAERRKSARSRTYLGGVMAFNKRASTMSCQVRNLSSEGAKVALNNAAAIPDQFDLTIARKDSPVRVRTVWRGFNEAGVAFSNEQAQSVQIPIEWAKRLRQSEVEKNILRQRIAELTETGAI